MEFNLDDILIQQNTIEDQRKTLNRVVNYFKSQSYHDEVMNTLAKERGLSRQIVDEHDVFFIDEDTTVDSLPDYIDETTGIVNWTYVTFAGRIVYPVKDVMGDVMGFCGWDKFDDVKYLDSKNYGYNAKRNILFGMERLKEYYASQRPVFLVEGIVDTMILRDNGFQALASLGSSLGSYQRTILSRFGSRLIAITDNDNIAGDRGVETAGNAYALSILRKLPKSLVFQTTSEKDIDDVIRLGVGYKNNLLEDLRELELYNFILGPRELRQRTALFKRGY